MKSRCMEWLGERLEESTSKSFFVKLVLWVGSISLTLTAFRAISDVTPVPFWLAAVGWLLLTGSWTTPDDVKYQLLSDSLQKGASWIFIFTGTAYVLFGQMSIWMVVVTVVYWSALFVQHSWRRKG